MITWVVVEPFGKSEAHRTGVDVSEIKEKVNEPDSENHSELNPGRSRITRQKKVERVPHLHEFRGGEL